MTKFLLSFLSIFSVMHVLFYYRVKVLLPAKWTPHFALIFFLVLMIFAPIGTRLLERSDHYIPARIIAVVGYSWIGYLFYAFWCFLLTGAAGTVSRVVNALFGSSLPVFVGPAAAAAVLAITLAINIYGHFEAGSIRVENVSVKSAKLPAGIDRLRIAQISDVHLGLLVREKRMAQILDKLDGLGPDILVSTGDLVDGDIDRIGGLAELFARIRPRLGMYAITGNHEVYAGLDRSIRAEKDLGFSVLTGEMMTVGDVINIAGVDDEAAGWEEDEQAILRRGKKGLFTLLLKHRPDPSTGSLGLFDLQLSGHTHYGQLFPFRYLAERFYPFQNGPYGLGKGSVLYTSRGSGTWGPPIRVLAPPEVTIIDIIRE